jgi:hypothetical protein
VYGGRAVERRRERGDNKRGVRENGRGGMDEERIDNKRGIRWRKGRRNKQYRGERRITERERERDQSNGSDTGEQKHMNLKISLLDSTLL